LIAADPGFPKAEADYEAVLYVIRDLLQVEELNEDDNWPAGIPHRQADKSGFDVEQQAALDLTMIATAYTLLHEVRHVMCNVDGDRPLSREEEMAGVAFARNFILARVDAYAENAARFGKQSSPSERGSPSDTSFTDSRPPRRKQATWIIPPSLIGLRR